MRKIYLFAVFCLGLAGMMACSGDKGNKMQDFANSFAEYVNANQMDSIKAVYPTANFDSVAPISTDSIAIDDDGNGKTFRINYSGNTWLDVEMSEDGDITVINSNGIAALPSDKLEIARNTGMITDSTPDVKKQTLLNDSTYFAWLDKKAIQSMQNTLTLNHGKPKFKGSYYSEAITGSLVCTVKNNSDNLISGNDYSISYKQEAENCSDGSVPNSFIKRSVKGKDVPAGGSVNITLSHGNCVGFKNVSLVYNKGDVKNYKPTGKEYQEYLESKK